MFTEHKNNIRLLLGMSVVIAVMIVAWWAFTAGHFGRATSSVEESDSGKVVSPAITSTGQAEQIDDLRFTLAELNKTAQLMKDSITYLEAKLIRAHVLSDTLIENGKTLIATRVEPRKEQSVTDHTTRSLDSREAGMATEEPTEDMEVSEALTTADGRSSAKPDNGGAPREERTREAIKIPNSQPDDTLSTTQTGTGSNQTGRWVATLASLSNRKQAEDFRKKVGMNGFDTSLQQVTIKGKDYWRVQVTGFMTQEEARSQGSIIKQRMGLEDIWISRR